jgi:hypothetical protein
MRATLRMFRDAIGIRRYAPRVKTPRWSAIALVGLWLMAAVDQRVVSAAVAVNQEAGPIQVAPPGANAIIAPERRQSDIDAIGRTLARYARALTRMDAVAAVQVWPSADQRALTEAFDALASNRVVFSACAIELNPANAAIALCQARVEYTPKIGDRASHQALQQWRFAINRVAQAWTIQTATAVEER